MRQNRTLVGALNFKNMTTIQQVKAGIKAVGIHEIINTRAKCYKVETLKGAERLASFYGLPGNTL